MPKKPNYDIATLGILIVDIFGKTIEEFPSPGTSVFFDTMEVHPGGCAFNTGVDATKLGLRVSVMGMVGEDSFGDLMVKEITAEGCDASGVIRTNKAETSVSFVWSRVMVKEGFIHTLAQMKSCHMMMLTLIL